MSVDKPTKSEIDFLIAAVERGWVIPKTSANQLDFAIGLWFAIQKEHGRGKVSMTFDEDGTLTGWRGLALREDAMRKYGNRKQRRREK